MFNETTFNTQFNQFTPDVFRDPLFGELRVFIDNNNQCWFIGYEVASRLGYKDTWSALNRHVFDEYKQVVFLNYLTGDSPVRQGNPPNKVILIHELGLYALVESSELSDARPFQKWVHKQIQKMRKYGVAMSPQFKTVMEIDEEQAHRAAEQRILEQQQKIEHLESELKQTTETKDLFKSSYYKRGKTIKENAELFCKVLNKMAECIEFEQQEHQKLRERKDIYD